MRFRSMRPVALAAAVLALFALPGCISLLPKQKPAQMYRFGIEAPVAAATATGEAHIAVRAAPTSFTRVAAGDRILTTTGDQTAYIAGARWVTAASVLFDDAVTRAFEASGGPVRLLARDEPVAAEYVLKLEVQTFEVRYDHGRGAAPTVVVQLYAGLSGQPVEGGVSQIFRVETAAESDTVHAIAAAFNTAVGKVLNDMTTWVEAKAQAGASAPTPAKTGG